MRTTRDTYRDELLLALRGRDVPGDRIGEVLAEVESHTEETGEEPAEAFGPPARYAREVAAAMGHRHGVWHLDARTVAVCLVIAVVSGASAWLLSGSAVALLGEGDETAGGLSPLAGALAGAALAAASTALVTAATWRRTVPVTDPRTGRSVSRPPRWALPVALAGLYVLLVVAVLVADLLTP